MEEKIKQAIEKEKESLLKKKEELSNLIQEHSDEYFSGKDNEIWDGGESRKKLVKTQEVLEYEEDYKKVEEALKNINNESMLLEQLENDKVELEENIAKEQKDLNNRLKDQAQLTEAIQEIEGKNIKDSSELNEYRRDLEKVNKEIEMKNELISKYNKRLEQNAQQLDSLAQKYKIDKEKQNENKEETDNKEDKKENDNDIIKKSDENTKKQENDIVDNTSIEYRKARKVESTVSDSNNKITEEKDIDDELKGTQEDIGNDVKDFMQEGKDDETEKKPIKEEKNEVTINTRTGKYEFTGKDGTKISIDVNKKILRGRKLEKFRNQVYDEISKDYPDMNDEDLENTVETIDPNLYNLYKECDNKNNTTFLKEYVETLASGDSSKMPTEVVYDFRRLNSKLEKEKGDKRVGILAKARMYKIAEKHQELELAKIKEDPRDLRNSILKALGVGLIGAAGILSIGNSINQNNQPQDQNKNPRQEQDTKENDDKDKSDIEKAVDEGLDEIGGKVDDTKKKFKENLQKDAGLGIGSEVTLQDGTYYYTSELAEPKGYIDNRNNGDPLKVRINMIATTKDGVYENMEMNKGRVDEIQKQNPNCKVVVHIENDKGDLGWMPIEEFKAHIVNEKQQDKEQTQTQDKNVENDKGQELGE